MPPKPNTLKIEAAKFAGHWALDKELLKTEQLRTAN